MRLCVSKSLQNARNMCCWRLQQYRISRIQYSSSFDTSETRPETRKRPKKWADLCEAQVSRSRGAVKDFFDLGFAATVKTYSFSWPVRTSLSLVERMTFLWYCMRQEFGIRWKPSDYSKRKRSILRVHHMKLYGKRNLRPATKRLRLLSLRINRCRELAMYLWILIKTRAHRKP